MLTFINAPTTKISYNGKRDSSILYVKQYLMTKKQQQLF